MYMPDYKNGKIYKIECNKTGLCYYGSTTQPLNLRLNQHRCQTATNGMYLSSKEIMMNADYSIKLIEEYPCDTKQELLIREEHYTSNNDCVNMRKAYISREEQKQNDRDRYHRNREYNAKKSLERYYKNKDLKLSYYETHREERLMYAKNRYLNKKIT